MIDRRGFLASVPILTVAGSLWPRLNTESAEGAGGVQDSSFLLGSEPELPFSVVQGYAEYSQVSLHAIAAGVGISYEALIRDLTAEKDERTP